MFKTGINSDIHKERVSHLISCLSFCKHFVKQIIVHVMGIFVVQITLSDFSFDLTSD